MLSEYIKENYKPGEPIFLQDIKIDGMSDANIRQKIKKMTEEGEVIRYEQGIYYIPKISRLKGTSTLAPDIVARYNPYRTSIFLSRPPCSFTFCV